MWCIGLWSRGSEAVQILKVLAEGRAGLEGKNAYKGTKQSLCRVKKIGVRMHIINFVTNHWWKCWNLFRNIKKRQFGRKMEVWRDHFWGKGWTEGTNCWLGSWLQPRAVTWGGPSLLASLICLPASPAALQPNRLQSLKWKGVTSTAAALTGYTVQISAQDNQIVCPQLSPGFCLSPVFSFPFGRKWSLTA